MKQSITLRRTETRTIQLEVPQPLSRETLTQLANAALQGPRPEDFGQITGHSTSDWSISKLSPECECAPPAPQMPRKGARR